MKTKVTSKVKPIKAWAIIDEDDGHILAIENVGFPKEKPTRFSIGTWEFFIEDQLVIPVLITPLKKK